MGQRSLPFFGMAVLHLYNSYFIQINIFHAFSLELQQHRLFSEQCCMDLTLYETTQNLLCVD